MYACHSEDCIIASVGMGSGVDRCQSLLTLKSSPPLATRGGSQTRPTSQCPPLLPTSVYGGSSSGEKHPSITQLGPNQCGGMAGDNKASVAPQLSLMGCGGFKVFIVGGEWPSDVVEVTMGDEPVVV